MKNILRMFALIGILVLTGGMSISYAQPPMTEVPHSDTSSNPGVNSLKGKVVETMNSGGYTYINIEQDGKATWAAVPAMQVTVGQDVSVMPGFVMNNFKSSSLDRTFESIVFSSGIAGDEAKTSDAMLSGGGHAGATPAEKVENIKVDKAEGPDAYTVAELHAKRGDLDTKNVVLRGQVVKVGKAIMGKNWIHIQDGSGSVSDGTNDIIVTSQDVPEVGTVAIAKGTLHKDKDFGMGYFYTVIIEDGSIK
ncbi:hypothetical protein BMS3Abin09_00671 [bacterium BMS3Abin09]|nr:hypothetical protein BMS3Abin09_00671 [bacterium BMS3Abin09]GBE40281.1 hypothetical protein BMS3Bbin09_00158 [bacterium BMS3Bbin09]HDN95132.1 DNA-binding protein [Nitrospirota bacterium]HDO67464.1 DNA-binding protein [Nitrospirota bacterium]HEW81638.1 DNA-binding protein [Nitrospirota bacterium]